MKVFTALFLFILCLAYARSDYDCGMQEQTCYCTRTSFWCSEISYPKAISIARKRVTAASLTNCYIYSFNPSFFSQYPNLRLIDLRYQQVPFDCDSLPSSSSYIILSDCVNYTPSSLSSSSSRYPPILPPPVHTDDDDNDVGYGDGAIG